MNYARKIHAIEWKIKRVQIKTKQRKRERKDWYHKRKKQIEYYVQGMEHKRKSERKQIIIYDWNVVIIISNAAPLISCQKSGKTKRMVM